MGLERRRGWHDSQISLSALDETDPLFDLVVSVTESPHSEHWPVAKASKLVRSMLSHLMTILQLLEHGLAHCFQRCCHPRESKTWGVKLIQMFVS